MKMNSTLLVALVAAAGVGLYLYEKKGQAASAPDETVSFTATGPAVPIGSQAAMQQPVLATRTAPPAPVPSPAAPPPSLPQPVAIAPFFGDTLTIDCLSPTGLTNGNIVNYIRTTEGQPGGLMFGTPLTATKVASGVQYVDPVTKAIVLVDHWRVVLQNPVAAVPGNPGIQWESAVAGPVIRIS